MATLTQLVLVKDIFKSQDDFLEGAEVCWVKMVRHGPVGSYRPAHRFLIVDQL
jgi:hypothetical protein